VNKQFCKISWKYRNSTKWTNSTARLEIPGPQKTGGPSDEVLVWLSVWSNVQMICIWSSWCHSHSIVSWIQNCLTFLVLA